MLLNWPIPLLPIHLLWVYLLTDAFPALAWYGKEGAGLSRAAAQPAEPIINRDMLISIAVQSIVMTGAVLGAFFYAWKAYGIEMGRTYALPPSSSGAAACIHLPFREIHRRQARHIHNKNMNLASIVPSPLPSYCSYPDCATCSTSRRCTSTMWISYLSSVLCRCCSAN
jgi:magnesium-transporting ATPase (P-type)